MIKTQDANESPAGGFRGPTLGMFKDAGLVGVYPAFQDIRSGETHLATRPDGSVANIHVLDNLPEHWIASRNAHGRVSALKDSVIPGYFREGRFLSCLEWAQRRLDA